MQNRGIEGDMHVRKWRMSKQRITCLGILDPQRQRYPEADCPFPGGSLRTPFQFFFRSDDSEIEDEGSEVGVQRGLCEY